MASAAKSGGEEGSRSGVTFGQAVARQRPPRAGDANGDSYRFCVNWNGMLEPLEVPKGATVAKLISVLKSGKYAHDTHKLLVFKGLLLHASSTLAQVGIRDGSLLHLLLNDDPYKGKPVYIKTMTGRIRTLHCGPDFYIEDLKEELSYYPGELTAENTRLVYAGRLLQDQHTLREYNIQKPSMLLALGPAAEGRQLSTFVASVYPRRDQCQVHLNTTITLRLHTADVNDTHFFGQLLGAPDLTTLKSNDVKIFKSDAIDVLVDGKVTVDKDSGTMSWTPLRPLQHQSRYMVVINQHQPATSADARTGITAPSFGLPRVSSGEKPAFCHSRTVEPVQGEVAWDFFTEGYEPLRLSAVYPRPHTRVRNNSVAIILSFSGVLHPGCNPNRWVSVRGHDLSPPLWDVETKSLVFKIAEPLRPNEIVRVSIRENLVRGAKGESLYPLQQDGMIKTTAFRWKFYTAEESKYEHQNAFSSGVGPVLERLRCDKVPTFAALSHVLLAGATGHRNLGASTAGSGQNRMALAAGLALDADAGRMISKSVIQSEEANGLSWLDPTGLLGIGGGRSTRAQAVPPPDNQDRFPASTTPPSELYDEVPRKSNNATEWIF